MIQLPKKTYKRKTTAKPRTTEEIELMMAKKSVLDEFILPNLDN